MNYSDEPNVISEQSRSKKIYFIVGGFVLFFVLLASVALFPRLMEYRRQTTPMGPHEGSLYFISFEGARYSMELARSEQFDFYLHIFIQPVRDGTAWQPEDHQVTLSFAGEETTYLLPWDPETGAFASSELRIHPRSEIRLDLGINRGEETVWSGRRWSFPVGSGHSH